MPPGTKFEVESASIELDDTILLKSKLFKRNVRQRRAQHRYKLMLIIRFIFVFSECNYACQQNQIKLIINYAVNNAPQIAIHIFNITVNISRPTAGKSLIEI